MDDVISLDERRWRPRSETPWYDRTDLVGANLYDTPTGAPLTSDEEHVLGEYGEVDGRHFTGAVLDQSFAVARMLPEQTYVPVDYVVATLTAAVWWHKTLHVEWMVMEYDPLLHAEVPRQKIRRSAAVAWVDDDSLLGFGIISPAEVDEELSVAMDCVTDIRLELITSLPRAHPSVEAHIASKLHELGEKHDRDICPICRPPLPPGGLQVDG